MKELHWEFQLCVGIHHYQVGQWEDKVVERRQVEYVMFVSEEESRSGTSLEQGDPPEKMWVGWVGWSQTFVNRCFYDIFDQYISLKVHFFVPSPKSPKIFGMGESHRTGRRFKGEGNPF